MKPPVPLFIFISISCFCLAMKAKSQDTEFAKGFVLHAKLHSGMITDFHRGADLYVGGMQLVPQVTVVPGKLKAGIVAGGFYAAKSFEGQVGPTISVKLKTINAGPFGSAANIHLTGDHLWGTGKQKLAGGGVHVDLLNKLVLGVTAHKDYEFHTWWLQSSLGIRLSRIKKTAEPFNE